MVEKLPDSVKVRRFPLPWRIESNESAFWVVDAHGKTFGYCYFVDKPRGDQFDKITRAEALRIVRNIVKLPEMLQTAAKREGD